VDTDRVWFKSHHGVEATEVGRNPGLCASAIFQNSPYFIEDASTDARSLSNPHVAGEQGFRFYAAAPLTTTDGFNLGTLCVIDRKPRELSELEIENLRDLASLGMDQLELRLAAIEPWQS
jgi:GAF domain-containing protein